MYKVLCRFADKLDKNYIYEIGDTYPREGVELTETRIEELASDKNATGKVLIEEVIEAEPEVEEEPEAEEAPAIEKEAKPKKATKK